MERIKLKPSELQKIVKMVQEGKSNIINLENIGTIFTWGDNGYIEMDKRLYNCLANNKTPNLDVLERFKYDNRNRNNFVSEGQFNYLEDKLSRKRFNNNSTIEIPTHALVLDGTDVDLNGTIVGVSGKWDKNDRSFAEVLDNKKLLSIFLKQIYSQLERLEGEKIAHENIYKAPSMRNSSPVFNIVQNGERAKITGVYGPFVSVGSGANKNKMEAMWSGYIELVSYCRKVNEMEPITTDESNKDIAKEVTDIFEKQVSIKK